MANNFTSLLKLNHNGGTEFNDVKSKGTPIAMVAPEVKQNNELKMEITRTCAVSGCEEYKTLEPEAFFSFPEDESLRQIWASLTGRNDWTPTDYSYICVHHFSSDSFVCEADGTAWLSSKAVPSLKLPTDVLEVEYIDEETLENDYFENGEGMASDYDAESTSRYKNMADNEELLKLFSEVQRKQRLAVSLKEKLHNNMKLHNQQAKYLHRLRNAINIKRNILNQKKKKKSRILLTIQDKIKEDKNGLVLAMPVRQTDDLKNFALSIYKYSPQAYIYARNTLRTMLPSTDVLDSWLKSGFKPKNVMGTNKLVKVTAEQTESELSCKVMIM